MFIFEKETGNSYEIRDALKHIKEQSIILTRNKRKREKIYEKRELKKFKLFELHSVHNIFVVLVDDGLVMLKSVLVYHLDVCVKV